MSLLLMASCGRLQVAPANQVKQFDGGAFYALPMTMLTVEIPVVETTRTRVECLDDSLLLVRFGNDQKKCDAFKLGDASKTTYTIDEDSISITGRPVPDSAKVFFVNQTHNWRKNQSMSTVLNEFGILSKADITVEDHTFDIVVADVQAVAGIITSAGGFKGTLAKPAVIKEVDPCNKQRAILKEQLSEVQAARFSLLKPAGGSSDALMPEGALKFRLSELTTLEKQLIAQLTYSVTKTTYLIRRDVLVRNAADVEALKASPLFKLNSKTGLTLYVPNDDEVAPYENRYLPQIATISSTVLNSAAEESLYTVFIAHSPKGQLGTNLANRIAAIDYTNSGKLKKTGGFAYNLPVWAAVRLQKQIGTKTSKSTVAVTNLMLPQLGKIAYLPAKTASSFELNPATGALQSLSITSTGLTGAQITTAGTAASATAGLFKKDPPAAPASALEKLQKERSMLEEQDKILRLQLSLDSLRRKQANN